MASHKTKARNCFDRSLPKVSTVRDWVICGRRRLLSVNVRLSLVRGFQIYIGS